MILNIIALAAIGLIAYFHFIQGFFSATLSAILAILAAALAVGFHEYVVLSLLQGAIPDQALALMLTVLFMAAYGILRVIFDMAVPGNLRMPLMVDKVGAGVMGVVAGIFAVGILMASIQNLPFGPSIGGFARYPVGGTIQTPQDIPQSGRNVDGHMSNVLQGEVWDASTRSGLWIPADDIVINTASRLSSGAFSWGVNFSDIHPDYLSEAFFNRIGIQPGTRHVAINGAVEQVGVAGIYTVPALPQVDGEAKFIPDRPTVPASIKSDGNNMILIVRLNLSAAAGDADGNVRISPAMVRLVAGGRSRMPIGTVDQTAGVIVRANRPDDFLIVKAGGSADFVFHVPPDELGIAQADPRNKAAGMTIGQGVFIEAKRLGMADMAGAAIKAEAPPSPGEATVLRKNPNYLPQPKGVVPGAPAPVAQALVLDNVKVEPLPTLFTKVNIGQDTDGDLTFPSGTALLSEKKFKQLTVTPAQPISAISAGNFLVDELWVPAGAKLVQVSGSPPSKSDKPWEWLEKVSQFEMTDTAGNSFKPVGAWGKFLQGTSNHMIARYHAEQPLLDVQAPGDGRPTDVWIAFIIPQGTTLQELRFQGKAVTRVNLPVN